MAEKTHIQTLFAYHWDTTDRLIAGATRLRPEEHGPIHAILFHLLLVDRSWRMTLESGQQPAPLAAEDFPSLEAIAAGFGAERRDWAALLDSLSDEEIAGEMIATRLGGQQMTLPRWRMLHQVLLHGMQHHAELAHLLTAQGQSPGNIDFIFYR
ncbi:MAG: hypothetical protein HGB28_03380 [Oscillochloris sp.]|nr:hypothetical protein [Oscillochloris sp.]